MVNFEWGLYLPTSFVTETPSLPLQIRYEVVGSSFIAVAVAVVPISSSFFRSLSLMDEGAEERGRRTARRGGDIGITG